MSQAKACKEIFMSDPQQRIDQLVKNSDVWERPAPLENRPPKI